MQGITIAKQVRVPRELLEEYLILKAAISQGYGTPKIQARMEKIKKEISDAYRN